MKVMQCQLANIESQQHIKHQQEMATTGKTSSASQQTQRASNTSSISKRWQSQDRQATQASKQRKLTTRQALARDGNHRIDKQCNLAHKESQKNVKHWQEVTLTGQISSASQHTKRARNTSSIGKRWQSQERYAALRKNETQQQNDRASTKGY